MRTFSYPRLKIWGIKTANLKTLPIIIFKCSWGEGVGKGRRQKSSVLPRAPHTRLAMLRGLKSTPLVPFAGGIHGVGGGGKKSKARSIVENMDPLFSPGTYARDTL